MRIKSLISAIKRLRKFESFPTTLGIHNGSPKCSAFVSPQSVSLAMRQLSSDQEHSILILPTQYLRAMDDSNYDQSTLQRADVLFDVGNGKPILDAAQGQQHQHSIRDCSFHGRCFRITWDDGRVSEFSSEWVDAQIDHWKGPLPATERVLWRGLTEESLRSSSTLRMDHEAVLAEEGMSRALRTLYQYGILLVSDTPFGDGGAGVAALASALGGGSRKNNTSILTNYRSGGSDLLCLPHGTDGPLRTLYGTVWSTASSGQADGASVADSSYGQEGLPLHTDMTYHRDPPGLQIFTMVQPAKKGGESIFGDGFAAAERLRSANPEAFATLSRTVRRYRCVDNDTGWHLEASGPVISVMNGNIVGIRHNDLDRLPDLPPPEATDIDSFYEKLREAHAAWDSILAEDDTRLVVSLQQGETMVVANQVSFNVSGFALCSASPADRCIDQTQTCALVSVGYQRCFHGRYSFRASQDVPRFVMGCYVSQDELSSRFRLEGFNAI
jgi:Taurine catabolism dioxygenase TauD, TfdA family